MKLKVVENEREVEVLAEPYGSATLNLQEQTVTFNFSDDLPWNTTVKVFRELKRAISRNNKRNIGFNDTD